MYLPGCSAHLVRPETCKVDAGAQCEDQAVVLGGVVLMSGRFMATAWAVVAMAPRLAGSGFLGYLPSEPNTFLSRSVVRATGSWRMRFSSAAIILNKPSTALSST